MACCYFRLGQYEKALHTARNGILLYPGLRTNASLVRDLNVCWNSVYRKYTITTDGSRSNVVYLMGSSRQFWCLYPHLHDYVAYLHLAAQLSKLEHIAAFTAIFSNISTTHAQKRLFITSLPTVYLILISQPTANITPLKQLFCTSTTTSSVQWDHRKYHASAYSTSLMLSTLLTMTS